jgi:signal peptidase I
MGSSSPGQRLRTLLREHAESLILALVLALLVRWLVVSAFVVRSDLMNPALVKGDIVLGFKAPFGLKGSGGRQPKRGELVIFNCPGGGGMCLRRIVGLPGDRLEMVRQRLIVNGQPCTYTGGNTEGGRVLHETCLGHGRDIAIRADWAPESWGPTICPMERVFVLNDARAENADSRLWGAIPYADLQASAVGVWISLDWSASNGWPLVRWGRTFSRVN